VKYTDNPRSIKYYVKNFFYREKSRFVGKKIVDFPAGNGVTSQIIKDIGAEPLAFDLFPEYFQQQDIICKRADIKQGIPLSPSSIDAAICQEGIEHFPDQLGAFKKFNEILKPKASLIITTPNYSNLRAKMSYLLGESERFNYLLAPNEIDSIWMSQQQITSEIYFGHIFLIGIERLRCLAKLAGFKIKNIEKNKIKTTSTILLPFLYPLIYISNYLAYKKSMYRNTEISYLDKRKTYKEVFRLATNIRILIDGYLFVEFEKEFEHQDVAKTLISKNKKFDLT
jgi:SAM-dependent methyltransferase